MARKPQSDDYEAEVLFIKKGNCFTCVHKSLIRYIEVTGKYSYVFCGEDKFLVQLPLKKFQKELTGYDFMQVHRNYLVNLRFIQKISIKESYLELKGGISVPLSREAKKLFLKHFHLLS